MSDLMKKELSFFDRIYETVGKIPYGKVISYGQIARMLGRPRAAREVGWAMSNCPDGLPWQRVVMADGSVTGGEYAAIRRALLREEGVFFLADGRVDMDACRWDGAEVLDAAQGSASSRQAAAQDIPFYEDDSEWGM